MQDFREIARVGEVIVSVEPVSATVKIASIAENPHDFLYVRGYAGLRLLIGALESACRAIQHEAALACSTQKAKPHSRSRGRGSR